ncbi:MAG: carbohydrate ABC transporter permease [Candidatus Bruticola sp.]
MKKNDGLIPYAYLTPALILLGVLSLLPNLYSVYLAFTNYSLYHYNEFEFVGLRNFMKIISGPETATFMRVFLWTLVWAGGSVIFSQAIGIFLAILLNKPDLKGSSFYRTLFIVPWAIPAFISVLMWQGLLNTEFGAFNVILKNLGLDHVIQYVLGLMGCDLQLPIAWLDRVGWAHISVLMVNIWLAFPFQLTVCLGALQSVPTDVYEAADVDGASPWLQFKTITLPLLRSSLLPVLISSFAFNFNQFTAIYLLTAGGPPVPGSDAGATDILITYSYKLAFNSFQYGLACAYAIFIFILVATLSGINFKMTGAFDDIK